MERLNDSPSPDRRGTRRHPALTIALAIIVVLIVIVLIVPFFINVNDFRPQIESELSSALGRRVTLGKMSLSIFGGSLVANNIAIADDPAFSQQPFLQANSLNVGVHVMPLIFHRALDITQLTIDSPSIQLIQAANGKWNFSSLGSGSSSNTAATGKPQQSPAPKTAQSPDNASETNSSSGLPDLSVGEFKVENGTATVSSLPAAGKPLTYSSINLTVTGMSFDRNFPFQLSANLPAGGSVQLDGNAGPLARKDASDTPFHANLQLKDFNPVAAGAIEPSKGISMVANANAVVASDGSQLTSTGKVQAAHLQLARTGSPAPNPVDMDFNISENLDARAGRVEDIAVHTGNVTVHVAGTYHLTNVPVLDLHLNAPNLPVDQLEQLLPAVGVQLPKGSQLKGGTLTANLAITGPATATTIAGPVEIDNTTLAGFDLGSKIQGLNPLGGSSGATQIKTVKATVNSSPQNTQFSNIYADVPQIGTASGNGTVSPSGALNFQLNAKLSANTGVGALASQASQKVGGLLGGLLQGAVGTAQKSGIPLTITGTASSPTIRANLGAMLR